MISVASETLHMLTTSSVRVISMDMFGLKPAESVLQYVHLCATHLNVNSRCT